MSDHRGIHDLDPAERLAAALHRISLAVERREASAAITQEGLERQLEDARESARRAASEAETVFNRPIATAGPDNAAVAPAVSANLDALIARLHKVLDRPDGRDGEG